MSSFAACCLGEVRQREDAAPRKHRCQSEQNDNEIDDEEKTVEGQRHDAPFERVTFADVSLTQLCHERAQHTLHLPHLRLHCRADLDAAGDLQTCPDQLSALRRLPLLS